MSQSVRRTSFLFLCALPFVALAVASARPLRTAGLSQILGVDLFTAIVVAAWMAGPRKVDLREAGRGKQALVGILLIVPWAIISLLWVGLGPPFQATLSENYMRYLVLVWSSILVTIGFVILKGVLSEVGEHVCSTVGLATALDRRSRLSGVPHSPSQERRWRCTATRYHRPRYSAPFTAQSSSWRA